MVEKEGRIEGNGVVSWKQEKAWGRVFKEVLKFLEEPESYRERLKALKVMSFFRESSQIFWKNKQAEQNALALKACDGRVLRSFEIYYKICQLHSLSHPIFSLISPTPLHPWIIKTCRFMTHSHNKAKCANFQLMTVCLSYKQWQSPSFPVLFLLPFILLKVSNSLEVSKRGSRARNFWNFSPHRKFIDVKLLWQVSRAAWSDENKKRDDHDPALVGR
jgi:hypothetical protein